jgi:hypothetical protein
MNSPNPGYYNTDVEAMVAAYERELCSAKRILIRDQREFRYHSCHFPRLTVRSSAALLSLSNQLGI